MKKYWFTYIFFRLFKFIVHLLLGVIIFLISLVEVPLFFITHPKIFKNDLLYVFWHWSFGHTISGIDYASRLYYPNRISLIYIPHSGSNPYLPFCFEHNMDVFVYKSIIPSGRGHIGNWIKYFCLRLPLFLLSALSSSGKFYVLDMWGVYKTLSLTKNGLQSGDEKNGRVRKGSDLTGYLRLLTNKIGENPKLPQKFDKQCREAVTKIYPDFFKKPFVALLLREKGNEEDFETIVRCSGPQENYAPAVRFLIGEGYHVVGTGETKQEKFNNMPGYFNLENVNAPKQLLNVFLLMNCALFIGQQSGPFILPDSCCIPVLLTDAFPYHLGTFNSKDIILFKHFVEKTGNLLSFVDVFREHKDLALGYHFKQKQITVEPNSPEEILEAVKEAVSAIDTDITEEKQMLYRKYYNLLYPEMAIYYFKNPPPFYMLHKYKGQLLSI